MSKLVWDQIGDRLYETGVDRAVLYPMSGGKYPKGIAWNGMTSIAENPSGADVTKIYADNMQYLNLVANEEFGATLNAYMYPDEFEECDGSVQFAPGISVGMQSRKQFGLSYRTIIGNDTDLNEHGYKLHLIYGCLAAPSSKTYNTVNNSPEAASMSWTISTNPVVVETEVGGKKLKPTSHIEIDSTKVPEKFLKALEEKLYGGTSTEASLPLPDEVYTLYNANKT